MRINPTFKQTYQYQEYSSNNSKSKIIQPIEPLQNHSYSRHSQNMHNQTIHYRLNNSHLSKSKSKISQNLHTRDRKLSYQNQIQRVLTKENNNLKQHNEFLVLEIKNLYGREKKMKKMLKKYEVNLEDLSNLNVHLTNQLNLIVNIIMEEIQRIQDLLKTDSFKHSRINSALINDPFMKNNSGITDKSIKFQQVQLKKGQNVSTSFFAYSEPSVDHVNSGRLMYDEEENYIGNRLGEIKQKINYFMNNPMQKNIQNHKQTTRIPAKSTDKIPKLKIPSKFQILSTNTNSEYMHQFPRQKIKQNKNQTYTFQH